jgi:hypothetical protein
MMLNKLVGGALCVGLVLAAGVASAQEAPRAEAAPEAAAGHASGVMVQARLQGQGGLLSLGGGSGFLLGYQGQSYALGLGLGLMRVGVSGLEDNGSGSATLFQIMPTALVDVWHSRDGRARANVIGGVGYGRGTLSASSDTRDCTATAAGGQTCTTRKNEGSASAGFVPIMLGFGGDYYLSRNFALGAEVGLQAAFTAGLSSTSNGTTQSFDGSGNLQLAYGALRATFVLGD